MTPSVPGWLGLPISGTVTLTTCKNCPCSETLRRPPSTMLEPAANSLPSVGQRPIHDELPGCPELCSPTPPKLDSRTPAIAPVHISTSTADDGTCGKLTGRHTPSHVG